MLSPVVNKFIEDILSENNNKFINYIKNSLYAETPLEDIEDIFSEGITKLYQAIKEDKLKGEISELILTKYLFGIYKYQILGYKKDEAQIQRIKEYHDDEGLLITWDEVVEKH